MLKKILAFLLCLLFCVVYGHFAFAAGTNTVSGPLVTRDSGVFVSIAAVADSSDATFVPVIFDTQNNPASYKEMLGKWLTSVRTIPNSVTPPTSNYDIYVIDTSVSSSADFLVNTASLAIGSETTKVSTAAFAYVINGAAYTKTAVTSGTTPGNDVVPQNKYGAVAFDIDTSGTINVIEADSNVTGYASAALAISGVSPVSSSRVRLGYVTAIKTDGAFTFGTTALNAANTTVAYTSTVPAYDIMGGRLVNRSSTVAQEVFPANTADDNTYVFMKRPIMFVIVNNSVNSAAITIELELH